MARKNRTVVRDGCYNVTARVANRAFLLNDPKFRDRVVGWIYGVASFSGVEVDAWCVMENHLHLMVRVPPVPARYWTRRPTGTVPGEAASASDLALAPDSAAFSMRPRECRAPRWTPDLADARPAITPAGDLPSEEAVRISVADGVPLAILPRPETGFTMSDGEMVERLRMLYSGTRKADGIAKRWRKWRSDGRDDDVEREKDAYCRRMYNISQFMKTLKQRISETVNRETGHAGALWDGRFYSSLVGDTANDSLMVASYLAWNPVKPGLAKAPEQWRWSSYAAACDPSSPWHELARAGYVRRLGRPWEEVRARLESLFAERLPAEYDPEVDPIGYRTADGHGGVRRRLLTVGQLVKTKVRMFEHGGYISQDRGFYARVRAEVGPFFPGASGRSIRFFAKFPWGEDASSAA